MVIKSKTKPIPMLFAKDGKALELNYNHPTVSSVMGDIQDEIGVAAMEEIPSCFSFIRRRVYHKTLGLFIDDINMIADKVDGFIENYLYLKVNIDLGTYDDAFNDKDLFHEFIDDLREPILENPEIIGIIDEMVETSYDINIESENRDNQLQFKNHYAKAIIKSAVMFRLVIPFLCVLMERHSCKKAEYQFLEVIGSIFPIFSTPELLRSDEQNVNLAVKIQKFVNAGVSNTLYSDKVIWRYLKNSAIHETTMAIEIHRNILCNIIPKLMANKSVVSFFHVVIKNQLDYQFTSKFKVEYKPISVIQVDSDKPNPFTRIEQRLVRSTSELELLYNRLDVERFINEHLSAIDAYSDDFDWWLENLVIHSAQTRVLELFVRKFVNPDVSIYSFDKLTYLALCIIAKEWAKSKGYVFISYLMLAKPLVPTDGRKIKNRCSFKKGKVLSEVMASKIFSSITNHYKLLDSEFADRVIFDFLQQIINANFEVYQLPNGTPYQMNEEFNVKVAINEVLHYIEQI